MERLCPRCSGSLRWIADRDEGVCPLGHRTTGSALYSAKAYDFKTLIQRVQTPAMDKSEKDAGAFLRVLEQELNQIKNDYKRDLAQTIYGEENRMDYRTSAAELLELVEAGLLTKEEGRLIALDMFPTLKQKIAEKAYADAAKLPE